MSEGAPADQSGYRNCVFAKSDGIVGTQRDARTPNRLLRGWVWSEMREDPGSLQEWFLCLSPTGRA
jgi:hypothetical protein